MGRCRCGRSMAWDVGLCIACQEAAARKHAERYNNEGDYFDRIKRQEEQRKQQQTESQTIRYTANGYFKKKWYRNGDLYSGYMQDGYRHGKGKWTRATDKYTYDGDWYMSKRHGHGKEEMPGQWCFEGEFYEGKRNGFGKLICADGVIYEGGWKDDKKHGYGKMTYASGNRYEGEWVDGLRCGKGIYFNAQSGVTCDGEWNDDKLNGYVVVRYADGRVYEGNFVNNSKIGSGKETAPDGTVTLGHWEGDRFVVDSASRGKDTTNVTSERPEPPMSAPLTAKSSPEPEEKEFDISPESLADFMNGTGSGSTGEADGSVSAAPTAQDAPAVELMHDFGKRFCHFDQALYGIDKNGVLHISSRMKKNKEIIDTCNGREALCLSCYEAANIIILGGDGSVMFADSTWKKGLLADKEIKAALPKVQSWSGLCAAACGSWHFVGLRTDGTVIGEGKKMCRLEETGMWESVTAIACGRYGTVGLCEGGTVFSCGFPKAVADELASWTDITAIACGKEHVVGLRRNGTVVACGENGSGQCNVGEYINVGMISASGECTALVFNDGTVKALGKFADASIADEKGIAAAACANFGNILRLTGKGSIRGEFSGVNTDDFEKDFEW